MAVKLTEGENFLKVLKGETPDWVPRYGMGMQDPYAKNPPPSKGYFLNPFGRTMTDNGGFVDMFGVEYVTTAETGGMALPKPDVFILDDIRRWRDVIKVPSLDDINWELVCQRAKDTMGDTSEYATSIGTHVGYFQHLMNFMGFNNGLVAMYEEPDEVLAMYEYLSDFYCTCLEEQLKYVTADVLGITDDTATATNPFISPEMYRTMVKPYAARLAKYGTDRGMHIMMHNCGRCEDSIEDWRDFGVRSWNPAQVVNDLDGIKKKYGNDLVLIGCWDSQGPAGWPDAPEEVVRQAVRDTIDRFATNGGFMFWGSVYGPVGDEAAENKKRWMTEEYEAYRETPYK